MAASALIFLGCNKEAWDGKNIPDVQNLLYETSTFSCYSVNTKLSASDYDELVIVKDIPNLKIYIEKNPATKSIAGYDYVASYNVDGKEPIILYSKYTVQGDGYLLNYCTESGEEFDYFIPFVPGIETKAKGQAVANCLQDVYANHGWVSVWATVQSAFIPVTALAFAAACTIHNL